MWQHEWISRRDTKARFVGVGYLRSPFEVRRAEDSAPGMGEKRRENALAISPFSRNNASMAHLCSASREAIPGPLMNWSGRPGMPGAPTLIAGLEVTPVTGMLLAAAAATAAAAAPGRPAAAAAARCAGLRPAAAVCEKKAACAAGWFSAMKGLRGPAGPAGGGWGPPPAGPWGPKPLPNGDFSNLGSGMRRGIVVDERNFILATLGFGDQATILN